MNLVSSVRVEKINGSVFITNLTDDKYVVTTKSEQPLTDNDIANIATLGFWDVSYEYKQFNPIRKRGSFR